MKGIREQLLQYSRYFSFVFFSNSHLLKKKHFVARCYRSYDIQFNELITHLPNLYFPMVLYLNVISILQIFFYLSTILYVIFNNTIKHNFTIIIIKFSWITVWTVSMVLDPFSVPGY